MQKRNVLNSPRLLELKRHRRRAVWMKVLISVLGLSSIFILEVYLSRLEGLNINKVEILGSKTLNIEEIKKTIDQRLNEKYLWVFPKTNTLLYPESNIRNELLDKFKRLKEINFFVKNEKTLEVSLTERNALYTWCTLGAELPQCYFMDEDGYVFDEAPYYSGEVYFKFYGKLENVPGAYFFQEKFKQLISFKDLLINLGMKPMALSVKEDGDIEFFLSGKSENEPKIILKMDSDFQNVAENLKAALSTEPLLSKFKNKYSSLLYIDLRFGNRVFYKFQ